MIIFDVSNSLCQISIIALLPILILTIARVDSEYQKDMSLRDMFEKFVTVFEKTYANEADKEKHFEAFVENVKKSQTMNANLNETAFGVNRFTDYTQDDFARFNRDIMAEWAEY